MSENPNIRGKNEGLPIGENLGHRARDAALWNTGFGVIRDLIQFGLMLILVRLLTPEMYGQFGVVTAIIGFLFVFSARNVLSHVLQLRKDSDVDYHNHFAFGALVESSLFVFTNLVALALRAVPEYAQNATLLHMMSLLFLVNWPKELCVKMLQRELDWRRFRIIYLIGVLISAAAAVILAFSGAGVYALLAPSLLAPLVFSYELFVVRRWRPRWRVNLAELRTGLSFGFNRLGSELAANARLLIESLLFVAALGYGSFGVFGRAVALARLACQRVPEQLLSAIYPAVTKIEPGTDRYRNASARILTLMSWIVIPGAALFSLHAASVVKLIYGDQWLDAIPLVPWALCAVAVGALARGGYTILLGNNNQRECLWLDWVLLAGAVGALLVMLPRGPVVYLQGLAAVNVVVLGATLVVAERRGALNFRAAFVSILSGAVIAGGGLLAVTGLNAAWGAVVAEQIHPAAQLIIFGLACLVVARACFPRRFDSLRTYLPARLQKLMGRSGNAAVNARTGTPGEV